MNETIKSTSQKISSDEQNMDQIYSSWISIKSIFEVIRKENLIKKYKQDRFNCTLQYANDIESGRKQVKVLTNGKILFFSYKNGRYLDLAKILVNGCRTL